MSFSSVRLDHVVLRATDAPALTQFYCELLGGVVERELDIGLIQVRSGAVLIDIVPVDSELGRSGGPAPGEGRNLDHFCLRVEPFDEAQIRTRAAALGADASDTAERYGADGFGPSIYVQDPEGNTVELKGKPVRLLDGTTPP